MSRLFAICCLCLGLMVCAGCDQGGGTDNSEGGSGTAAAPAE